MAADQGRHFRIHLEHLTMISSSNLVFGIHAFDSFIRVECASSDVRESLERYLFPPLPRSASFAAAPEICVLVDERREGYRVLINHEFQRKIDNHLE